MKMSLWRRLCVCRDALHASHWLVTAKEIILVLFMEKLVLDVDRDRKSERRGMVDLKCAAIAGGVGALVAAIVCFVLGWTLPKREAQVQPIKQEFEIHKLQKDFKVIDLRVSVV